MPEKPVLSGVCVIGAGRVGSNLLRWLTANAADIVAVISPRIGETRALMDAIRPKIRDTRISMIPAETRHVFLCVPDAMIRSVAAELAPVLPRVPGVFVAHVSGARTSQELSILDPECVDAGSFHPMQSFATDDIGLDAMRGIGIGIEGPDRFAERAGRIAGLLGWTPVRIQTEDKDLYHAACVFAGNFLPAVAAEAISLLAQATDGIPDRRLLLPMMRHVLARLENADTAQLLTGPAARGDTDTVASHLARLSGMNASTAHLYASLTRLVLDLKNVTGDDSRRLKALLAHYLDPPAG